MRCGIEAEFSHELAEGVVAEHPPRRTRKRQPIGGVGFAGRGEQCQRLGAARHPVGGVGLGAGRRDRPHRSFEVELAPAGTADLARSARGERQQLQRRDCGL